MPEPLQVHELRKLTSRPPSKTSAEFFLVRLDTFCRYLLPGPTSEAALREVRNHVTRYVAAHTRERWRKPPPELWQRCVEAARRAADAWEHEVRSRETEHDVESAPSSQPRLVPKPSPFTPERDAPEHRQDSDSLADAADRPVGWLGGYVASVPINAQEVPRAAVRSQIERSLAEYELGDAKVTNSQDQLRVWWEPDEEEQWERDLLKSVVENAVMVAGVARLTVRVRWVW